MYFGTKKLFEKQPLPDCQTPSIEFGAGSFFFSLYFYLLCLDLRDIPKKIILVIQILFPSYLVIF
jgi:hypothetical protein